MFEIILMESIEHLGHIGDRVKVKSGYARNFLLPKRKALRATKANIEKFNSQKAHLEAQNIEKRENAKKVFETLNGLKINVIRSASEMGHLYGSVRNKDICESLSEKGFSVERAQVYISPPIKTLGLHTVQIILHSDIKANVIVNVAQSEEEAEAQEHLIDIPTDVTEQLANAEDSISL